MVILFNKPYGVLSQFTPEGRWRGLRDFGLPKQVYAAGRLDADSEGLLLLSDDGGLIHKLTDPKHGHPRSYWVQVEGIPDTQALSRLSSGVELGDFRTRPCLVNRMEPPTLPPRDPPIRFRKSVPDCWLAMELTEGKNRQVRRMTAAVGNPTLRLVRAAIGGLTLERVAVGQWLEILPDEQRKLWG